MKKIAIVLTVALLALLFSVCSAESATLANPMVETDEQGLLETLGVRFNIPEGAQDVKYFVINGELGEAQFTLINAEITVRIQPSAEFTDISGAYYEWTVEEDDTVGVCEAKTMRYIGEDETVDVCLWFDVAPGIMYSVTAIAPDLDGFDVTAIAEQVYAPLQGEAGGDEFLHVTDIFVPDGGDAPVVQGCFGNIDFSNGEWDMEFVGFDPEETYTLALADGAVLEMAEDPTNPITNVVVEDLSAWYEGYKAAFLNGDESAEAGFYATYELDEDGNLARLSYVYLP